MNPSLNKRFWEVDSLRGLAIVMMVVFHFIFDLNYFGIYSFNTSSGFLWWFARITASMFIFLVGVSLSLSYARTTILNRNITEKELFLKYLKRGLKIFSYGLLITASTYIFIGDGFIVFGILHFIGIAIILEYVFIKRKYTNLFLGLAFIAAGIFLTCFRFNFYGFLWLGFIPNNFYTVDYFPLLPWLGIVSFGIFLGNTLYEKYVRQFKLPDLSSNLAVRISSFLGKHSLLIYLIHQPIIVVLLFLLGFIDLSYFFTV
ncbi:MAG TPA: heparan-alpha-glucosaminide N-acetyltransferase [Methanobacterium sp.]|nr:heparan-alpha-glucosaminide N-acetyltransferase [Methanobacterium sp.]